MPDIVVEETANGSNGSPRLREADLDRHLINDKEKEPAKEAAKPEAKSDPKSPSKAPAKPGKDKSGKDEAEDEMPVRLEYASKSDLQFQQAINLLKGLQIMQNRSKD
jgi:carboxyl-terminal processing protease